MDINFTGMIGLAYLFIRILFEFDSKESTDSTLSYPAKEDTDLNSPGVNFFSNGKRLDTSLTFHYLDLLEIDYKCNVSEKTIEEAARRMRKRVLYDENGGIALSLQDIQSARLYLLDQWRYFIRKI